MACLVADGFSGETFVPYKNSGEVPQNATDLWKDYDPRAEDLDVKVVKEWQENGAVTRYITFKVGTFKGADARVAAYYSFPENAEKAPAFVWCHGGGQRAERGRGVYFAKQGFATVDVNWLGREMEPGITENTAWGKVDPTQGPRFYANALRKSWKRGLDPDEHTIDPVASPRNNNWFLLVVAAKRAITFLEQQPEVNAGRIGLSGFSMGGTITSMAAIDPRLKAVAPFVGGTGFLHKEFPGVSGSSLKAYVANHLELYTRTVDPAAYWPLVKCPVLFLNSSNDFHAAFDRVYQSMALLPHKAWRVSMNVHENHRPGAEQWALLNQWFNLHLKGVQLRIPATPSSRLEAGGGAATFTVTPENLDGELLETEIYYSYDPNSRTRFWKRAEASPDEAGNGWSTTLALHKNLPLYAFALCRYAIGETVQLQHGSTSTITLTSAEQSIIPDRLDRDELANLPKTETVFEDFSKGLQDWASRNGTEITTYKFQSPSLELENKNLCLTIAPGGRRLSLRLEAVSQFLGTGKDLGSFSYNRTVEGEEAQQVVVRSDDFKSKDGKALKWSRISRFSVVMVDTASGAKLDLSLKNDHRALRSIRMIDAK